MYEEALPVGHDTRCHWFGEVPYLDSGGDINCGCAEKAIRSWGRHSYSRQHSCVYTQPSEQLPIYKLPCLNLCLSQVMTDAGLGVCV